MDQPQGLHKGNQTVNEESTDWEVFREYRQNLHEGFESLQQQLALFERLYGGEAQPEETDHLPVQNSANPPNIYLQIIAAIQNLTHQIGRANTIDIAAVINLSRTQTWRYLIELETNSVVERVGKRGGWRLPR